MVLASAMTMALEVVSTVLPEIAMFLCALLGTLLFSGHLLGRSPLMDRMLALIGIRRVAPECSAKKKIVEEDEEEDTALSEDQKSQATEIEKELSKGNVDKALQLWHKTRFTLVPSSKLLTRVVDAMLKEGAKVQEVLTELVDVLARNPAIYEGDAMECLLVDLEGRQEQLLYKELVKALQDMDGLSSRLQYVLIAIALRKPEGLSDALELLQQLPENAQVPSETATKLLCLAGSTGRLPAAVALLMDLDVAWTFGALDAPMAEARDRKDVELCLQLHKAAQNLGISQTATACMSLLCCLEENTKADAPVALRMIAEDIVQDPCLEIDQSLALALVRAGLSPHDEAAIARVLGRPRS